MIKFKCLLLILFVTLVCNGCAPKYGLVFDKNKSRELARKGWLTVEKPNKFKVYKNNDNELYLRHWVKNNESIMAGITNELLPVIFTEKLLSEMGLKEVVEYSEEQANYMCERAKGTNRYDHFSPFYTEVIVNNNPKYLMQSGYSIANNERPCADFNFNFYDIALFEEDEDVIDIKEKYYYFLKENNINIDTWSKNNNKTRRFLFLLKKFKDKNNYVIENIYRKYKNSHYIILENDDVFKYFRILDHVLFLIKDNNIESNHAKGKVFKNDLMYHVAWNYCLLFSTLYSFSLDELTDLHTEVGYGKGLVDLFTKAVSDETYILRCIAYDPADNDKFMSSKRYNRNLNQNHDNSDLEHGRSYSLDFYRSMLGEYDVKFVPKKLTSNRATITHKVANNKYKGSRSSSFGGNDLLSMSSLEVVGRLYLGFKIIGEVSKAICGETGCQNTTYPNGSDSNNDITNKNKSSKDFNNEGKKSKPVKSTKNNDKGINVLIKWESGRPCSICSVSTLSSEKAFTDKKGLARIVLGKNSPTKNTIYVDHKAVACARSGDSITVIVKETFGGYTALYKGKGC